jgi:hypothetical protein
VEREADGVRRGADEYAVNVLVGLEGDLVKTLGSVKKGIAMLDERRAELLGAAGDPGDGSVQIDAAVRNGHGVEADETEGSSQPARL